MAPVKIARATPKLVDDGLVTAGLFAPPIITSLLDPEPVERPCPPKRPFFPLRLECGFAMATGAAMAVTEAILVLVESSLRITRKDFWANFFFGDAFFDLTT